MPPAPQTLNTRPQTLHPFQLSTFCFRVSLFLLSTFCFLLSTSCQSDGGEDLNTVIPKLIDSVKGPGNLELATDLFNSTNPDARRIAIAAISQKPWGHEEPYMKAYRMLATDKVPLVRAQALRALGSSHRADVADLLIANLGHENPIVRSDAAAAACDITNEALVEPLLERLRTDPDDQVRINSARALEKYRQPRVLRALADALDDKAAAVVLRAHQSLITLTGQQLPQERRLWTDYLDKQTPAKPT